MDIDEERLLHDTEFVSAEALKSASETRNTEAKAQLLMAAQIGNLAKAVMCAGVAVRCGLRWVSDSIDAHCPIQQEHEQEQDSEDDDEPEDEDEDEENGPPDAAIDKGVQLTYVDGEFRPVSGIPLVEKTEHTRKRYVRSVDDLKLERICD